MQSDLENEQEILVTVPLADINLIALIGCIFTFRGLPSSSIRVLRQLTPSRIPGPPVQVLGLSARVLVLSARVLVLSARVLALLAAILRQLRSCEPRVVQLNTQQPIDHLRGAGYPAHGHYRISNYYPLSVSTSIWENASHLHGPPSQRFLGPLFVIKEIHDILEEDIGTKGSIRHSP